MTDEAGVRLPGVALTGRILDDYWHNETAVGTTDARGEVRFKHVGPACVGAIAFVVTAARSPGRTLDRTAGVLANHVIPTPTAHDRPDAARPAGTPAAYVLEDAAPNPSASSTTLRFRLSESARVRLVLYDALGREVARLVDAVLEAGRHEVRFDASALPRGVYAARFAAGGGSVQTRRLTLGR